MKYDRLLSLILAVSVLMSILGAMFWMRGHPHDFLGFRLPSEAAASSASTTVSPSVAALNAQSGTIKHVFVIVLENEPYTNVISNNTAPYLNRLAERYGLATNYFSITHPSEANYIALIAGSTFNITDTGPVGLNQRAETSLVDLMKEKNVSWRAYQESMPAPCYTDLSQDGLYANWHDPFVYMERITSNTVYCNRHIVNFTSFYSGLDAGKLPKFIFITPNLNDDGHDTNIEYADGWLSGFLPKIIDSSLFNSSVIAITFDEGAIDPPGSVGESHIATLLIGPPSIIKPGFKSDVYYNHYSLLATVEDIFHLGTLGRNDVNATPMTDFFQPGVLN